MESRFNIFAHQNRKDAGVVELARLESVCTSNGTVGSNPTLSAIKKPLKKRLFYYKKCVNITRLIYQSKTVRVFVHSWYCVRPRLNRVLQRSS